MLLLVIKLCFKVEEVSARSDWAYRLDVDQAQRLMKKLRDLLGKS